jgi:hypothetical protein
MTDNLIVFDFDTTIWTSKLTLDRFSFVVFLRVLLFRGVLLL